MYDNENAVIRMFSHGAKGFILKNCEPVQLEDALHVLLQGVFFYAEPVSAVRFGALSEKPSIW